MSAAVKRRVVVTGMGVVSPLGNSPSALWEGLKSGRSGVGTITQFPAEALPMTFAAEAREFTSDIENFGPLDKMMQRTIKKGLKVMCREIQMGVAAAQNALYESGLDVSKRNPERTGVTFGSDYITTMPIDFADAMWACRDASGEFNWPVWGGAGLPKIDPLWLLKYLPNMPASHVAIYNDLRGPSNSITLREASGNLTLAEAYCNIRRDVADVIVAGATGSRVHPIRTLHVVLQEETIRGPVEPLAASRPFESKRDGMVLGEGAAALILEDLSHAQARGAKIYAEIIGHGAAMCASANGEVRSGEAVAIAARKAIASAGLTPDQIGHVNSHGLSTRRGDRDEAHALKQVFGERPVPVVAAKSNFGNLGAGGGVVELVASIMALSNGHLFPTLNYDSPDPECPIAVTRSTDVPSGDTALNLSYTPQGQASALIVRSYTG